MNDQDIELLNININFIFKRIKRINLKYFPFQFVCIILVSNYLAINGTTDAVVV